MFGNLIKALTNGATELPPSDARLALAALLVRIARSDGDYAAKEVRLIDGILANRYGLLEAEAQTLRQEAEAVEREAPDTVRFTRAIKDAVPYDDRLAVMTAAWAVVLADGSRAEEEDALMRMIASLLGISDMDSARARKSIEDR